MRNNYKLAIDAAIHSIEVSGLVKPKSKDPRDDLNWVKLKQLYQMNQENLQKALFAVSAAESAKWTAIKVTNETKAQLELLAEKLGIDLEGEDFNE